MKNQYFLIRTSTILTTVLWLSTAPLPAETIHAEHDDATAKHSFEDVERWSKVFDNPERDIWQKPAEVMQSLALKAGMRVADLGAGTGYFTRHLARAVGASGSVLAVEVEPNLVRHLRQRAEQEGAANVTPILGSTDNPRLPAGVLDLILIVDTYHHIDDRLQYMRRVRAALAPAGRIAIIDWYKKKLPEGPPVDHKIASKQVIDEMQRAGYRLEARSSLLPYQYFLIFSPEP
ncbi:MAG TPA: class I SAM-dependent methyltransferase [Terriglobales bacterium]|nr:class I SAM-dependent methyltransferase [Terriglobales bacterium]